MKQQAFITTLILAMCASGFGACNMSLQEICVTRFPAYEKQFGDAIAALAPWDAKTVRALASEGVTSAVVLDLHSSDREAWGSWAQDRLNETQAYLDIAAAEPDGAAVRRELSDVANELVTFHGYAGAGRAGHMINVLKRIEDHSARIRQLTCPLVAKRN